MKRGLRASFVVTVAALGGASVAASCNPSRPPPRSAEPSTAPATSSDAHGANDAGAASSVATAGYASAKALNPIDGEGRTIFLGGDSSCFVLAPKTPPSSMRPPAIESVACPPAMNDAAWKECAGGSILPNATRDGCVCVAAFGNPPPVPHAARCPK